MPDDLPPPSAVDPRLRIDPAAAQALAAATVGDPFALLGPHPDGSGLIVRAYVPGATGVDLLSREDGRQLASLTPVQIDGLFAVRLTAPVPYRFRIYWPQAEQETEDPYGFGLLLGELDLHLIAEGKHFELAHCLGARAMSVDGIAGVRFAVWAPNARRVSVVGGFNGWDGRRHPMRKRVESGVWELFIPRLGPGEAYKYEILGPDGVLPQKADPVASQAEAAPGTASIVADPAPFAWTDQAWMARRARAQSRQAPISIYEVHAGSWQRAWHDGRSPGWDALAETLIPYVVEQGFTHLELLPVMVHPFGGSWGYQPLGLFAPQADFGEPAAFARFVDAAHAAGIGVILDWVPAHFPTDPHGLAQFDGTHLYEHADPREGFHQDWNTLIYNLGRREVHGFVLASGLHWLEHFHIDGLRVDAVASMLYRDYSRKPGEWVPNVHGGRENLESVGFLQHLNAVVAERCPGAITIAEESTAWPGVTQAVREGGLGFDFKWNMGWMHDTLHYVHEDPINRKYHHDQLTFGLVYAFSERFVLPLSHDEVVHGKGSLINKMPGDPWQQFANLRAYFGFMWSHPGKKLLFMGGELAQRREWSHDRQLDWHALSPDQPDSAYHRGVQAVVRDLNRLYARLPALHQFDTEGRGFRWLIGDDRTNSVFAYVRFGDDGTPPVVAVCNFTPVPRERYRVGLPRHGRWLEVFNSDAASYGGSGLGNCGGIVADARPTHGQPFSAELTLPPLATVLFVWDPA